MALPGHRSVLIGINNTHRRQGTGDSFVATPVDVPLPLAIAPVAPLHAMQGRCEQRVIKQRQDLLPMWARRVSVASHLTVCTAVLSDGAHRVHLWVDIARS